jgi:1,4-dihydroxy-6-naphthoate synthase
VELPFDKIAAAVLNDELDAGVLIHEELLNWRHAGLNRIACLGELWKERTGLPIPVGLVVMHRRYGDNCIREFSTLVRQSMVVARENAAEARRWAMQYSREAESGIADQFMAMFANDDTLSLDTDCIRALNLFYDMCHERGLIAERPDVLVL